MDSIKNFFNSLYSPKDSDFYKFGYLTPDQFVLAGDQLTKASWKWQSAQKPSKLLSNPKKQFLTADARSSLRIKDIMNFSEGIEKEIDGGWFSLSDPLLSTISKDRNYTLSITYDEYYHCPRIWLSGFDEEGNVLKDEQIFEDVMNEYQNETVTVLEHPFLGIRQVSIHPCKHSEVMKNLIGKAEENGGRIEPHQALFVFLKFMSSVIPTIEYDFTADVHFEFK